MAFARSGRAGHTSDILLQPGMQALHDWSTSFLSNLRCSAGCPQPSAPSPKCKDPTAGRILRQGLLHQHGEARLKEASNGRKCHHLGNNEGKVAGERAW
jgi:hypothetical protein